ncbi:OmpA family protein [Salmonirosea aquatica]|uniref:OmpA family protein n=1 Tax=Salmonirosea aquatica TaxID=2654236 RepID=A0A7C9BF75_9BACT|nr:OmpA family protein [Cytophagaceae bacterium SJW1-29]
MKLPACLKDSRFYRLCRLVVACLLLEALPGYAQSEIPKQQADRSFYAQDYPNAAQRYSELLKDNSLSDEIKKNVLYNLGYSYQKLGDFAKAESHFRELLEMGEPAETNRNAYLYYAQALAHNGKLSEAQDMYTRYESIKSTPAVVPLSSGTASGKAKVTYRVETLSLNTSNAEFSPAYFRQGLVYVGGKGASGASSSPDKGYLNLLYVPDRTAIDATGTLAADGTVSTARPVASAGGANPANRRLGRDTYTASTANDSRTAANFAPVSFSESLGLGRGTKAQIAGEFSKELNTKYHEGPLTFSADGNTIYFTRNNYNEGKSRKSSDNVNKLKLYTAELRDGVWTDVKEMPFNSDEYSTGHPALSRDGKSLYFVSDRPGGKGGTDIYVSRLDNGTWSAPVNLGSEINTKGDEMFPFMDENDNLYFASNGRPGGMGGLDIYFAPLATGGDTPAVVHLDAPINSKTDDFGLITDGSRSTGYFSSNRLNGDDDLFRFVRESSLFGCRNLTIRVFDDATSVPLDSAMITVRARGEGGDPQVLATDATGLVNLCLEAENDFMFEIARDGYLTSNLGFSTAELTDDKPTQLGASLIKLSVTAPSAPSRITMGSDDGDWESEDAITASTLRGTVTGEADKKPLDGVRITLKNECDGQIKQTVTGPSGRFRFELVEGCDYTLVASKPLYGTNTSAIRKIPEKSIPKLVSANLMMIKAGDLVTLDNINYDSGKWEVRPDAARELDKMVATMQKYPSLRIEIGSHTDSQGDAKTNQILSERRAKAALNYMASKGIARNRLTAIGYGETQLLNNCKDGVLCTEEEHQRNRRTEFKVLYIK